jgi:hypothetical protein
MIIYISLFVALLGLIVYLAAANPKAQEVGRIAYAFGLLAFLLTVVPRLVTVVK